MSLTLRSDTPYNPWGSLVSYVPKVQNDVFSDPIGYLLGPLDLTPLPPPLGSELALVCQPSQILFSWNPLESC